MANLKGFAKHVQRELEKDETAERPSYRGRSKWCASTTPRLMTTQRRHHEGHHGRHCPFIGRADQAIGSQGANMMAVDAFVEIMHADGTTNPCTASDLGLDKDPSPFHWQWNVDVALRAWRIHEHNEVNPRLTVRVIDTDGVVVEQWPK